MPGIPTIPDYPLPAPGDLPSNTATWRLDPNRAVLLVHDMQHFFLRFLPEGLRADVVRNAQTVREQFAAHRAPVAYSAQPGDLTVEQRGLLLDFWGPGMRAEPADRQVVDQLAPAPGDWLLTKWRYSAFYRTDLLAQMRAQGRDQLVICGVYAHIGVLATAMDAFTHDVETFVVGDAVADFSVRHHRLAMEYLALRCAVILSTKEVFVA